MKKVTFLFTVMLALLVTSCAKDLSGPDPATPQDVIFTSGLAGSDLKTDIPDCDNPEADYALVNISGTTYYPATFYVNGVLYTQAIKLAPGNYSVQEFILFNDNGTPDFLDDDLMVKAAPHAGSAFGDAVLHPLDVDFTVEAFTKIEVEVDVICYEEAHYENFGFVWFRVETTRLKKEIFFGDFCDEYFLEYAGSYYGDFPKVDMPAIYEVAVYRDENYDGIYETLIGTYNNLAGYVPATATDPAYSPPLEVPYTDRPDVEDRYEFRISIYQMIGLDMGMEPVFGFKYFDSWYFSDDGSLLFEGVEYLTDPSGTGQFTANGDKVYDFVVGFCVSPDTDIDIPDPDYPSLEGCETAFAFGGDLAACFIELGFHRWGWVNDLSGFSGEELTMPIYAGAGQCDIDKGTYVGDLVVHFNGDNTVTVTYTMLPGTTNTLKETHLYIGSAMFPVQGGNYTVAPGQFGLIHENLNNAVSDSYTVEIPAGGFYLIAHAVVCGS